MVEWNDMYDTAQGLRKKLNERDTLFGINPGRDYEHMHLGELMIICMDLYKSENTDKEK